MERGGCLGDIVLALVPEKTLPSEPFIGAPSCAGAGELMREKKPGGDFFRDSRAESTSRKVPGEPILARSAARVGLLLGVYVVQ